MRERESPWRRAEARPEPWVQPLTGSQASEKGAEEGGGRIRRPLDRQRPCSSDAYRVRQTHVPLCGRQTKADIINT